MGSAREEILARAHARFVIFLAVFQPFAVSLADEFSKSLLMSLKSRRLLLLFCFLWAVGCLFFPVRHDNVTGRYTGDTPDTHQFIPASETVTSSLAIGFNGHPAGIAGLFFFLLMPFFIVWESFSFKRPFSYGANAFMRLQALLLILGAPYCYYMATFEFGNFSNTEHTTTMAWGGWILFAQNLLLGILLFIVLASPKSRLASFFSERG